MEELKDVSIHHTALKLTNDTQMMKIYGNIFKMVQKLACSPDVDKDDMKATLGAAIKMTGLEIEVRNIVFHLLRASTKADIRPTIYTASELLLPMQLQQPITQSPSDPLNYLRRAGGQWERRVKKSLNAMCVELNAPIQGQQRLAADKDELTAKWEELSNYQVDLSSYRPVYATKDLLEVLLGLRGPNKQNEDGCYPRWEFSHIALPVRNLVELRIHFSDLLRQEMNVADFTGYCIKVLNFKHSPLCQQVLKKGATPAPWRGELWSLVLGSHLNDFHPQHWNRLKASVCNLDIIVDKLIFKDVQLTATNDDQYFVFEDVLYQVMLNFSRDHEVNECVQSDPPEIICNGSTGSSRGNHEGPPSGIVPFHGICMFAAPFAYLYDNPIELYFTFRAFYVRYCHRLTTINTHPQGIVSLCLLYEKLLQTHEPELWSHFRELQIQPIRVVFKWLMRAFSGHLPPDQLLILWDLVIGYDSLEILSLLAIVVLGFRKDSLMQVSTIENIEAVLADLSSIKVLPLIQLALCRD